MRRREGQDGTTLVELLVSMVVMSIVATAVVGVVTSTQRTEVRQSALQQAMDDGRISMSRVRTQLRGGRRVLPGSDARTLKWWSDVDQDGIPQPGELITYCSAPLGSTTCATATQTGGRYQLVRWDEAAGQASAAPVAQTLTSTDVFSGYAADDPGTPATDEIITTRTVTISFLLEAEGADGLDVDLTTDVRLRNVE